MRISRALVSVCSFTATAAVAGLALAAEAPAAASAGQQSVNISPIAAPIVYQGRLINYIFLTIRLDLTSRADVSKIRDKEPYFRDALVRAAHSKPFVKSGDYTHLDEPAVIATMMAAAQRIVGPGMVAKVVIVTAQPQKTIGLPRSSAPDPRPPPRPPIP